jgi:TonB family protein
VRKDGHFYDRLAVPDSTTNQVGYLWFNADFDASSDPAAIAAVKDGVLATTTAIRPGDASVSSRVGPEAGPANSIRGASLGPGQLAEGLLHNEDVIKMVKAGFDDALIIEKVGNSKCQFDTSADALIQLKQSGASGPVVRAVMEAGAPRGLALTGHVVWNGLPVPNAKVQLAHRDSVSAPASARTVTANDGAFTIQDPPAGDLMIWVYAPSSEYTDLAGRAVTITAGHPENIGSVSITKKLQLLSPTVSEIATTTPALEWAPFPDSVRYNVYVFNDSTRQRILLRSTKDTRMTVPAPLPNGQQLRWGVQAYNSKGEEIAVSWWRFTIASPKTAANTSPDRHEPATLIQRSNAQTQVTGRVVWNGIPVPNALVQLWQSGDHNSLFKVASTVSAADGTFTMQEPPTGSLKIGAVGPSPDYVASLLYPITITAGQTKNVGDLALSKKLQLLSPANGATVTTTTPTLQWAEFPDAARYEVRVFSSAMNQAVFSQSTQSAQVTVPSTLQLGQQYQWDVYAYNSRGQGIARGSGRSFTIQEPSPASTGITESELLLSAADQGASPPVLLYKAEPEYPEEARKARYQGTVVLYVEVDTSGRPANVRVLRSIGLGLDEKALQAVKRWRFKPAMKDGVPVAVSSKIEITFRLN